jgi:hypothetical protein
MSCWVVPAIAAELWGVTLAQVLAGVADGTVRWQREHGFLFVDASARGHSLQTTRKPQGPPPPTFVPVTREGVDDGFDAIIEQELPPPESTPDGIFPPDAVPKDPILGDPALADSVVVEEDPELPPLCEEEDSEPIGHWRQRRQSVARTRRPPPLAA